MNLCPSLFKPTSTLDGILTRVRIPCGVISFKQIEAITCGMRSAANLSPIIHITNRANIQIRTSEALPDSVLKDFQNLGLAAQNSDLDHLRNVMISPTAGIDAQALIDTRPLAIAWLKYIENHPELAILSQKFSIGIDGGEAVSVGNRLNDISLKAIQNYGGTHTVGNQIYFSLSLVNKPTGVVIKPENVLEVLANLAEIYRQYATQLEKDKPPRLRDLINDWGMMNYLERVASNLAFSVNPIQIDLETEYAHLGVHDQKQSELAYIGVVVPLGRLESFQFRGLGEIAKEHSNGYLKLTPWQNLIISDISKLQVTNVKERVAELGLSIDRNHAYGGLVACTGITGCKSGVTDTKADARAIANHLQKSLKLDHPINIHLTGCEKSCAQHQPSDITLLGIDIDTYRVFIGEETKFGREFADINRNDLPELIESILRIYQGRRVSLNQSFQEFVNGLAIAEIKSLLNSEIGEAK